MNFSARDDGAYTTEELLKCQAFIVFSHAEVETYLENLARRILNEAKTRWISHDTYDRVIVSLLAFRRQEGLSVPQSPKVAPANGTTKEIIEDAFKAQSKTIDENNGMKRSNLSSILCPLGILPDDIEEVLLLQLDKTGRRRGDMVHKANKVAIRNIRDPFSDEQRDIENLINEIEKFDSKLEALGFLLISPDE
jgi:hypothetical protein